MRRENGFTLIELLAVLVVLAIILAISIPSISGFVEASRKKAFEFSVNLIIEATKVEKLRDVNYNINNLNRDNMKTDLGIDNENYESVSATTEGNKVIIDVIGQNKWDGLEIHGYEDNLVLGPSNDFYNKEKNCGIINNEMLEIEYTATEVTYEYYDASTELMLSGYDDGYGAIDLGFSFPFGGQKYSRVYVSSNGYITIKSALASEYSNGDMANNGFPMIAPLWNDWMINKTVVPGSGVFYSLGNEDDQKYVLIEYRDILNYGNQSIDATGDFEVKLYEDGTIKMSYKDVSFNSAFYDNGKGATAGVNSNKGYLQYSYNSSAILHDNLTVSFSSSSHTTTLPVANDVCFTFDSATGTINGYDELNPSCPPSFIFPETIGGVAVQHIGDSALDNLKIKNVVLPNSLTTIGNNAFEVGSLICAIIPEGVTSIGDSAFTSNQLSSVVIPNSVTSIGNNAFGGNYITNANIPTAINTIPNQIFDSNNLTSIYIPNTITAIGNNTFQYNQLTNVDIPNSVTSIGTFAFGVNLISSVFIPNSVTSIGNYAFSTNKLTSVTIPNSVTTIGSNAFNGNQLSSLVLPNSVTSIGEFAFTSNQLSSLVLSSNVTSIGREAFSRNQLTSLSIPNSVTSIGFAAFNNNLLPDVQAFIYGRNADGSTNTTLVSYGGTKKENVTIPNDVTTIGDYAFDTSQLASINIPNGVTSIGSSAFYGNQLTSVNIPASVTSIGTSAFSTNQLTSIVIPNSVTTIGNNAFYGNQLASIVIPNSVTSIGSSAFNTNLLTNVAIPNSVTSIGSSAFRFNIILQGNATIDRASGSVSIGSYAFNNNGATSTTTITPVYLR